MLSAETAHQIIDEVFAAMKSWRIVARQCGIGADEQSRFVERMEEMLL